MITSTQPAATASFSRSPMRALADAARALRKLARNIVAWADARERAVLDRDVLANMSDRELLDIGVDRASVASVASGRRVRDHPY